MNNSCNNLTLYNNTNNNLYNVDRNITDTLGYLNGFIVCIRLLPQIIKIAKTKSASDLSHKFLVLSLIGAINMMLYGVFIDELPIIITTPIIFSEFVLIMVMKIIYDARNKDRNFENNNIKSINNNI